MALGKKRTREEIYTEDSLEDEVEGLSVDADDQSEAESNEEQNDEDSEAMERPNSNTCTSFCGGLYYLQILNMTAATQFNDTQKNSLL